MYPGSQCTQESNGNALWPSTPSLSCPMSTITGKCPTCSCYFFFSSPISVCLPLHIGVGCLPRVDTDAAWYYSDLFFAQKPLPSPQACLISVTCYLTSSQAEKLCSSDHFHLTGDTRCQFKGAEKKKIGRTWKKKMHQTL